MKAYRLKHVPTGLYYQPQKHRGSHLSSKGKVYQTVNHGLSDVFRRGPNHVFHVYSQKEGQVHKKTSEVLDWVDTNTYREVKAATKVSDWVEEEVVANNHNVLLGLALSLLKDAVLELDHGTCSGEGERLSQEIKEFLNSIKNKK